VVALGYLSRGAKDESIVQYLAAGMQATEWRKRLKLRATSAKPSARPEDVPVDEQLAISSIQALGLTGSQKATDALAAFIASGPDRATEAIARDALRLIARVQAAGESVFIRD
jgi:hypothetical protein